jgi:uncharacterized protein (TIGR03437 family)
LTVTPSSGTWTASSNQSWLHITSASTGTGSATINYAVDANNAVESRTGTVTVGTAVLTVAQAGSATYTISGTVTVSGGPLIGTNISLTGSKTDSRATDSNGNYSFSGLTGGGTYLINPVLTGFSFTPVNAQFSNLAANQTANFSATLNALPPPPPISVGQTVSGTLTAGSPRSREYPNSYADSFQLWLASNQTVAFDLKSKQFHPYIMVYDATGTDIWMEDGTSNYGDFGYSIPLGAGTYIIEVNTWADGETGSYTLSVQSRPDLKQGCTYTIVPTSTAQPSGPVLPSGGGTGTVTIQTQTGCGWNALVSTDAPWLSLLDASGQGPYDWWPGIGTGQVYFEVGPNSGTQRVGRISVWDQALSVTQQGPGTPNIQSVSPISTQQNQTITISGGGFGSQPPYVGDSQYIDILDLTGNWQAGILNSTGSATVTLNVSSWTDTQIVLQGFAGSYGCCGYVLNAGDQIQFKIWNASTGAGPATFNTSVSGGPAPQGAVDLSRSYNVTGIYTDGSLFSASGGLDGIGNAFSASTLQSPVTWNGSSFNLGPANAPDAVSNATIPIAGRFGLLNILAVAVNGSQENQIFAVKYTDGSISTFTQSISDWYAPQHYASEAIALTVPYRLPYNGGKDTNPFNIYGYSFQLASGKTVSSVVLPNNANVVVLAITLANTSTGPSISKLMNAASFSPNMAPGTWVTIFGANLSGTTRSWASKDFNGPQLPTALDGVSVTFNGRPGYISYISPAQVNALIPGNISTGPATVQITNASGVSNSVSAKIQTYAPSLFTQSDANGTAYAIAISGSDWIAPLGLFGNGVPTRSVSPGEYLTVYALGLGQTNPPYPEGQSLSSPLPVATLPEASICGKSATVAYAGLVYPGEYQLNLIVPDLSGVAGPNCPLVVSMGGIQSVDGVFVPVKVPVPTTGSHCTITLSGVVTSVSGSGVPTGIGVGSVYSISAAYDGSQPSSAPPEYGQWDFPQNSSAQIVIGGQTFPMKDLQVYLNLGQPSDPSSSDFYTFTAYPSGSTGLASASWTFSGPPGTVGRVALPSDAGFASKLPNVSTFLEFNNPNSQVPTDLSGSLRNASVNCGGK